MVQLPGTIRDKTADYHSFALVTTDLDVTPLPASVAGASSQPFYFWKHSQERGEMAVLLQTPPNALLLANKPLCNLQKGGAALKYVHTPFTMTLVDSSSQDRDAHFHRLVPRQFLIHILSQGPQM